MSSAELSFEEFMQRLLQTLDVEFDGRMHPYLSLFEEIGLDSVQAFEMLIVIEQQAGLMIPPLELPSIYTAGDAYEYYCAALKWAADEGA